MMSERNFYEILQSSESASFDELKTNYKRLILQCHPDKLLNQHITDLSNVRTEKHSDDPNDSIVDSEEFVVINEAWNTLKDAAKRKLYDSQLLQTKFQMHSNVFERLKLSDMRCNRNKNNDTNVLITKTINTIENCIDGQLSLDDGNEKIKMKAIQSDEVTGNDGDAVYTYDCRCGGQYIIDESSIDEIRTDSSNDASFDDEFIVECSECSLVIILNG